MGRLSDIQSAPLIGIPDSNRQVSATNVLQNDSTFQADLWDTGQNEGYFDWGDDPQQELPQAPESGNVIQETGNFLGNALMGFADTATFGILGLMDDLVFSESHFIREALSLGAYDEWDQETGAGKWGRGLGSAAGMLVPFSATGKGLNIALRGLYTKPNRYLWNSTTKIASKPFMAKYAQKEGAEQITSAIHKIGGIKGPITGLSDDVLDAAVTKGYRSLMDDAYGVIKDPIYKKLIAKSNQVFAQGVDEMAVSIAKQVPGIGRKQATTLADDLLREALHHSNNSFHMATERLAGKLMGIGVKGQVAKDTFRQRYLSKFLGSAVSDFFIGATMHTAEAAIQNLYYYGAQGLGLVDEKGNKIGPESLKHLDQRGASAEFVGQSFGDIMKRSATHGLWFSLIGPTRFIKGGSNWQGKGKMYRELQAGAGAISKGWSTRINKMSGTEAKFNLHVIDGAADGLLHQTYNKIASAEAISNLTGEGARNLLKQVRWDFTKDWSKWFLREMGSDLTGSAGRMIAGMLTMNAPNIYHHLKENPDVNIKYAFGEDGSRIVENILVGMMFSKGGRSFNTGTKTRVFESGKVKEYYAGNTNEIQNMRRGLEILGMDTSKLALNQGSKMHESTRGHVKNQPLIRDFHELVMDFYTDRVTHTPSTRKDIERSFDEYLVQELKLDPGSAEYEYHKKRYKNFESVLSVYDNYATDVNMMFRTVTKEEAFNLVEATNKLSLITQSKDLQTDLSNAILSGWHTANESYKNIKKSFIITSFEALGLSANPDPTTGVLVLPKVANLNRYFEGQQTVRQSYGNTAIHQLNTVIQQGVKDGWIKLQGSAEVKQTVDGLRGLEKAYTDSKTAMTVHVYGPTNTENGAFPHGGTNGDLMILGNEGMRQASLGIDHKIQLENVLSIFNVDKGVESLFNTLPKDKLQRITQLFNQLGVDQNPTVKITDSSADPKSQSESIDVFNKVVELYKILNVKGGSDPVPVAIDQIETLRKELQSAVGDAFETSGEALYQSLTSSAFRNFQSLLKINNVDATHSVTLALDHLIRGNRILETKPEEMNKTSNFVLRTKDGLVMPDADILMDILKTKAPDKVESIIEKEGLRDFYKFIQASSENAGNIIKFTKDMGNIDQIVDTYGADKIIELMTQAKVSADIGGIKDLIRTTIPLELLSSKVQDVRDKWILKSGVDKDGKDKMFFEQLEDISRQTLSLNETIKWAMRNHDYRVLTNINLRNKDLKKFLGNVDELLGYNVNNAGGIDLDYKKSVADRLKEITTFMNKDYGSINLENYGKYVEKELKKSQVNLDTRHDETITNITASQFEARYGLDAGKVAGLIKPYIDRYKDSTTPGFIGPPERTDPIEHINQAFDRLNRRVVDTQEKLPEEKRRSLETRTLDVYQTVLQSVSMKEINKVKWVDGHFQLSKDYMLNQYDHGPLALMYNLGIRDRFYTLDQTMEITDSQGRGKITNSPTDKELLTFSATIENNLISLDVPLDKLNNIKGRLSAEHQQLEQQGRHYMYVAFGEGNNVIIPISEARAAVAESFRKGGYYQKELQKLFPNPKDPRYQDAIKEFSDIDRLGDVKILESAILTARLLTDAPTVLIDQVKDIASIKDVWKRLKMPVMTKGRTYSPEVLEFTKRFYRSKAAEIPYFKHVADAFDRWTESRKDGNMRFVSIDDTMDGSVLNSKVRLSAFLNADRNKELFSNEEKFQILAQHESIGSASTFDAATYMTKDMFLIHLAQLGVRKEFVHLNENGDIIGFQAGAIKPKGVHVSIADNGGVQVWYDKTAIFYDPAIDAMLARKGMDGVVFKSGNKVNKFRENADADLKERFIKSDRLVASDTPFEDMEMVFNGHIESDVISLPLSTFNVTNISKKNNARLGANVAVHLDHNVGIDTWMQLEKKVDEFSTFLQKSMSNEFALTSLAQELMGRQKDSGDLMLSKIPVEHILNENGLILDQWMGDVVADKLFTYFFQGSKIATGEIGNSSISPASPPIHHKLSNHDFAIRTSSSREIDGRSIDIKRQKIIGSHIPDAHVLDQAFSFLGVSRDYGDGNYNTAADTGFFVRRISYNIGTTKETADFVIIPSQAKKGGAVDWKIRGNGYELTANELIDLNAVDRNNISHREAANNADLYNQIIKEANKIYTDIQTLQVDMEKRGAILSNRDVSKYLHNRPEVDKYSVGMFNNRQPRNVVNDVVLNKLTTLDQQTTIGGTAVINKGEAGEFKYAGNKGQQNITDVIESQDMDNDYDKSSTYMSAPPDFIADVSKKSGYGINNDSDSFAKTFFSQLDTKLTEGSSMKKHLAAHSNSALLRGRLVKMHNVVTYFMNALQGDAGKRVIGNFEENGVLKQIRMKSQAEYFLTVDNISNWAKIFIDNYDNPTKAMNINSLVQDILFGRGKDTNGNRHYEGLFEVYDIANDKITPYIDTQHSEVRGLLYKRLVQPINKYLRLNRGMTEVQEGQKESLRLKDIANGWSTLNYELNNPDLYLDMAGQNRRWTVNSGTKGIQLGVDLRPGMQSLINYVTGGRDATKPHPDVSQNPFDVAMRTLSTVYNNSFHAAGPKNKISEIESLFMKAEAGVLLKAEGIESGYDRHTVSQALFDYVQNDYGFIEVSKLNYRIQSLTKDIRFLKQSKFSDESEISLLESKRLELTDIKSDLEIMIGYEFDYANGKKRTIGGMEHAKGSFKNHGEPVVFWHTQGKRKGRIAGVIQRGGTNRFDIEKSMVAIQGGRKFELANPMKQKALFAKAHAFHSLPFENSPGSNDLNYLTGADIGTKIEPKYEILRKEMTRLNKLFWPPDGSDPKIDKLDYSVQRKGLINRMLNKLDTELERKALIWMMLQPKVDNTTIAYRRDKEGRHINEMAYKENALSKPTWQLLIDIYNDQGFNALPGGHTENKITKLEAHNLIKEIVGRQTLASLGVDNPYLDVNMSYDMGTDYRGKYHRKLYTELNREKLNAAVQEAGVVGELALTKLNEFMNGDRLVTPAEMYKLEKVFKLSDGLIFLTSETTANRSDINGGRIPESPVRNFGRGQVESVTDFVKRFNAEAKDINRKNCLGK